MPYMVPCIYILPQDPSTGFSTLNFNIEVFTVLLLLSRVNQACFQHSFSRKKKTKTQNKTQEFTFLNWNRCDLESTERRQVEMQMFFIILILFLYIYAATKMNLAENVSPFHWVAWHTWQICLGSAHPSCTPLTHTLPVLHCWSVIWNVT